MAFNHRYRTRCLNSLKMSCSKKKGKTLFHCQDRLLADSAAVGLAMICWAGLIPQHWVRATGRGMVTIFSSLMRKTRSGDKHFDFCLSLRAAEQDYIKSEATVSKCWSRPQSHWHKRTWRTAFQNWKSEHRQRWQVSVLSKDTRQTFRCSESPHRSSACPTYLSLYEVALWALGDQPIS